ncbi:hypothetical protein SAMN06295905_1969 [Devosia lucknowensis]|uniref:Uncharacterized protein n=2 Tax=Devosia lucknowensis TaxID=1096929 RepID=A0A1Y6FAW7_9HYPH|nr:hypothetical protein SAMN06295905_1969 [Devosia lucknowensis]
MRDRYYRLLPGSELPVQAALVRIRATPAGVAARIEGDLENEEAAPDLMLFRAALARIRYGLVGIFVVLDDGVEWNMDWGDLVDYRGGRNMEKPAPSRTPVFAMQLDLFSAWDYTLNLNSMTSPSLTT